MPKRSNDRAPMGPVVKAWRIYRGMSSTELAEKARIRTAYLSELENGVIVEPRTEQYLLGIARVLGIDVGDLLARRFPPETQERRRPSGIGNESETAIADARAAAAEAVRGPDDAVVEKVGDLFHCNLWLMLSKEARQGSEQPAWISRMGRSEKDGKQVGEDGVYEPVSMPSVPTHVPEITRGGAAASALAGEASQPAGESGAGDSSQSGTEQVVRLANGLLRQAAKSPPENGRPIRVTLMGRPIADAYPELMREWERCAWGATQAGWWVTNLVHPDRFETYPSRYEQWLDELRLTILGAGRYEVLLYMPKPSALRPNDDLVVVPGHGGLVLLPTGHGGFVDSGWYIPAAEPFEPVIRLMEDRFEALCAGEPDSEVTRARGVFRLLPPAGEGVQSVGGMTAAPGSQYFAGPLLSDRTMPKGVFWERLLRLVRERKIGLDFANRLRDSQERRADVVRSQVGTRRFLEIHPMQVVRNYSRHGTFIVAGAPEQNDDLGRFHREPATKQERIAHFQGIIEALDERNYELALVPDEVANDCPWLWTFWLVQGPAVAVELWPYAVGGEKKPTRTMVRVESESLAKLFEAYFMKMWQQFVPDAATNKLRVREVIREQIRALEFGAKETEEEKDEIRAPWTP